MSATSTNIASVLNDLIETLKDGQYGFQSAAEMVTNPDYKSFFTELSNQRAQFVGELQTLVRGLGEEPEQSGSLAGTLHRGWIDLKASFQHGDEHSVLSECERGEDSAVSEYRDALAHDDLPADVRQVVLRQSQAVQATHDRVRDLRDSHAS